jgi:hypothetical protein
MAGIGARIITGASERLANLRTRSGDPETAQRMRGVVRAANQTDSL